MTSPGLFKRFFWFCSGANTQILRACPESEQNRFAGIGATVFFTGLLAACSGGYAMYTVFGSVLTATLLGLLWGAVIFNLDRFMVASLKKEGTFRQQFGQAVPRLVLALILAIVISKPLELRIFEPEIREILTTRLAQKQQEIETVYAQRVAEERAIIAAGQQRLEAKYQARESAYESYKCECDGTCGTGRIGRGSECQRKEEKYLQSNREYLDFKAETDAEAEALHRRIDALRQEEKVAIARAEGNFSQGLVARLSASGQLPPGPGLMIPLLIFLIEISPLLVKLLSPRGPYDEGLKRVEEAYSLIQLSELQAQKLETEKLHSLREQLAQTEIDQQTYQRKRALQALANARLELVKEQIDDWLREEKAKLRQTRKDRK